MMKPAVLLLDKEMNIILTNRLFVEIFQRSNEEVKGKPIVEVLVSDELARTINEARSGEEANISSEINYTVGNSERHFELELIKMERQEVLVILLDITEERDRQERLYLTDRLASIGEMAAGVAHELDNPLTCIIGLTELLLNTGTGYSDETKEDLKLISEEAQRAAEVVKSFLTFARKHEPIARPVQINNVIESVIRLRSYEHKENNLEVVTKFDNNLPEIIADQFQLQQVLLNLVLNAEQAILDSKKGKMITITTQNTGEKIKISIADDGPGISPDNIHKIFSPFFTTKGVGKGTGLGLSICYGIITNHSGNIHAESEPNKGANFVIELPTGAKNNNSPHPGNL